MTGFLGLKVFTGNIAEWARSVVLVVNGLLGGKINSVGSVTLTVSDTTTTVPNAFCSVGSVVLLTPVNSAAAGVIASTYVTAGTGSFVITHTSTGSTRNFRYAILG